MSSIFTCLPFLFCKDSQRISYGDVRLGQVSKGKWRFVTEEELSYCQRMISTWTKNGSGWDKASCLKK